MMKLSRIHVLSRGGWLWLLACSLLLSGCAGKLPGGPSAAPQRPGTESAAAGQTPPGPLSPSGDSSAMNASSQTEGQAPKELPLSGYQAVPEDFSLSVQVGGETLAIANPSSRRKVEAFEQTGEVTSWRYPDEQISVSIQPVSDYLSVAITSLAEGDHTFTWPAISAGTYYLPLGEGKRVPAGDAVWNEYLSGRQVEVMEELSMPFWAFQSGDYTVLYIMEDPYRTQMNFSSGQALSFSVSHDYAAISDNRTQRFRIYITGSQPSGAAKLYRDYVKEMGRFVTLEEKAAENPDIRKLYGAPFIYLWGENLLSADDIHWQAFCQALSDPVIRYLASFADSQENGQEFLTVLKEIQTQDYVALYQKHVICGYISGVLKESAFWNPSVFAAAAPKLQKWLSRGYENLNETEKLQLHKYALAGSLPQVFTDAGSWMDGGTVKLVKELADAGLDRAWIGLNSWEQAYAKPELAALAVEQGYLIGSYDSYHSIHEPGGERWITARFPDASLYENATVTDKNGDKVSGFQNVGRKLNPALSLPAVKDRMERIMKNQIPFNSWFIDCDATGEIYDDYTPGHVTSKEQDAAARLERMAWIRDRYKLVIGSEGGNDFAAPVIAFAHGIELKSFSWMDEDMKSNRDSEYYIGKYYHPAGNTAEHFSKPIPVKDKYKTLFVDPQYDIPLYKLVYNDSVITSYHWDWSTFKIQGEVQDRMLREVLYNVPPLYHLDAVEWEKYKEAISRHHSVWSPFSREAVAREMTGFTYLTQDGLVQKTCYGEDLSVTANFGDTAYPYEGGEIPPHSLLLWSGGEERVYTPYFQQ